MAISGKVGAVYVQTTAAPVAFTDEATTKDATLKRYTIANAAKRYWDKNTPVLVQKNGEAVNSGFTIEYAGGVVVFDSALLGTDAVTVSGANLTVAQQGGFFNWSADLEVDLTDTTTFASNGWKENTPTVKGFSASAEAYWGNSDFLSALGQEMVIVLYVDSGTGKNRYEGFGIISSDSIEDNVDDVVNESIEIQGTGPLYYREG